MKLVYIVSVLAILGQTASAQDSSQYSFGGACSSQGVWTQAALTATQNLRKVTLRLKDDANCKTLGTNIQASLDALEQNMKSSSDTPDRSKRLSQLPAEISSLRMASENNPDIKDQAMKLMMDRSVEQATLSAQVAGDQQSDFGTRLQTSARNGMQIVNQIIDTMPQMDQCLIGDGSQILGSYVSSLVKLAAAFGSSGQDVTGGQLATTISKLTTMQRERRFTKILRQLNQQEFKASISCLMELTTESYCQARDSMKLFKKAMADVKMHEVPNHENQAGDPFVGYYILNTHVPNVTKWIQKIQVGVDPKLPTDAIFQNGIQQDVVNFFKSIKTLQAAYNSKVAYIKALPKDQQANAALKLLVEVTQQMTQDVDGSNMNFFTQAHLPMEIPFLLLNLPVPDEVSGKKYPQVNYYNWYQGHIADVQAFKDTDAVLNTMWTNMNGMIHDASLSAIQYYNRWYIVDKSALVNEAMVDVNYTVKDSLIAIQKYLEYAKQRVTMYHADPSLIPTMIDTQVRIQKILDICNEIEALGKKYTGLKTLNLTQDQITEISAAYERLVNVVYDQFIVMQTRSSFLANRMVTFVYQDYVLLLKNKVNFTPYEQALFYSQGMAAFDRMIQIYNGNPANVQTDLNMALNVNNNNIQALDMLLKDSVIRTLADLRNQQTVEDRTANGGIQAAGLEVVTNSYTRLREDQVMSQAYIAPQKYDKAEKLAKMFYSVYGTLTASAKFWLAHADRYPLWADASVVTPQSEFSDAENLRAQLCVQGLAFTDQNGLYELCRGAVLKSPIVNAGPQYNIAYDQRLTLHIGEKGLKPKAQLEQNHSDRICAFRDYNRMNMVKFMGVGKNQ